MGIRKYNPTTPGLRGMTVSTFEEITETTPEKSLTAHIKKNAGSLFDRRQFCMKGIQRIHDRIGLIVEKLCDN